MKREAITDKIEYIEPQSMKNFTSCAGIIIRSGGTFLIDTNMGSEHTVDLLKEEQPEVAIISHYHLDHSTWGRDVIENSNARLLIPGGEEKYLTDLNFFLEMTAGPFDLKDSWRAFTLDITNYRTIDDFLTYSDGEIFDFGGVEVRAVGSPGHSPSHSSFYFPEEKILFTGDLGIDRFGPWYGWIDCNLLQFAESLERLKGLDINLLLTSHGGIISDKIEETFDKLLCSIADRERSVVSRLDDGMSHEEVVFDGVFYGNKERVPEPMRSFLYMWDHAMLDHHLEALEQGGVSKFLNTFNGCK